MEKSFITLSLIAAMLPLSASAGIGNSFSYIGLGAAYSDFTDLNFTPDVAEDGYAPFKLSDSSSGFGTRFFYGQHFGEYLAVEAGANFMSKPDFKLKNGNSTVHKGEFSTFGLDIKAFATFPITNSQFIRAHAGVLLWDNSFETITGPSGSSEVSKKSDTDFSPIYGIGYGYAFNKSNALVLEFERTEIADVEVDNISISFLVKL